MALSFSPFGLVGAYHPSGIDRPSQITPYRVGSRTPVTTGFTTLFKNCAISIDATSGLPDATFTVANPLVGVFLGVEYTESSQGRRLVSPYVAAGTSLIDPVFYINADPNMIFEAQLALSGSTAASPAPDTLSGPGYIGDTVKVAGNGNGFPIVAGVGTGLSQAFVYRDTGAANGSEFVIVDHGWDNVDSALWYDANFNTFPTVRLQVVGKNFNN